MLGKVSDRQAKTLSTIQRLRDELGYPPTYAELCAALGVTRNAVAQQLERLKKKGLVDWSPNLARTLRVIQPEKGQ